MGHSIAAKYAARPAARFVRQSSRAKERRLGLGQAAAFAPKPARQTVLRGIDASPLVRLHAGRRGARVARPVVRNGRLRPSVQVHWARSARSGSSRRPSAAAAPWHA